jgi:hypothetical protein
VDGNVTVFDPNTRSPIPQGSASDGGGAGFDVPAILWIGSCFFVGTPLAVAGVRGWRLTTGAAIGLSTAVCAWAALINTVNSTGISDIILTAVILVIFVFGFILGLFEIGRLSGIALLGIIGGLAFGIRIILLRDNLLVPLFFVNWLVIAAFGAIGGLLIIFKQRVGITLGAASVGAFLFLLGIELAVNKQSGMSRGLRFLFDRNDAHIADIAIHGYKATLTIQILIGVSLALTPILAYAQHRFFPQPFSRKPVDDWELGTITSRTSKFFGNIFQPPQSSRFST